MTNKEKFLILVSDEDSSVFDEIAYRRINRYWIKQSQNIAVKVLLKLEKLKWDKQMLAERMNVPIEDVNLIVKGTEDLKLSIIVKLQEALRIKLLMKK